MCHFRSCSFRMSNLWTESKAEGEFARYLDVDIKKIKGKFEIWALDVLENNTATDRIIYQKLYLLEKIMK